MTAAGEVRPTRGGGRRSVLLTAVLMLPASLWYLALLVAPLIIVVVYSFGVRARDGGYAPAFTFDNYQVVATRFDPFLLSLGMAVAGTALCALIAFPLSYFIATRVGRRKSLLIILLVIPFWTSFLIRTIAWLTILGPRGMGGFLSDLTGQDIQLLGTPDRSSSGSSTTTCR